MTDNRKQKVLIIDNSIAYTGALKAAIKEAVLLSSIADFVFIIPAKGISREFINSSGFRAYQLPMIEVSRSPANLFLYIPALFLNFFRLKKIVRKEKVEIIQVNDFYNLLGVMLKFFGWKGKLITYVRFLPASMPGILRKIWTRLAQRYSFKVIAVSDAVLNQLPSRNNVIRIYDPVFFKEQITILEPDEHVINLLYLANYTRGKGQEYAIKAFVIAYQQNKKIRLHYYGGDMGLPKNKTFRMELEAEVKRKGLDGVIFFNDFASDVESVIKEADIVLNFSDAESFSMTCAEASFYRRPIIATRSGGPEEIIKDGVTGYLVNKGEIQSIADKILLLSSNSELRLQQGIAGRSHITEKFSEQQFVLSIASLIN